MNELQLFETEKLHTLDSREVAEMVGKQHAHLMRDIRQYCEYLNQSKVGFADFFIDNTYKDDKGETRPCFLVTRKGCEMIANKMTGGKGVLFTATYINRFHEMEQAAVFQIPKSLPEALRLAADLAEENAVLSLASAQKDQIIGELKPKADYTDRILQSKGTLPISVIAKDYGMSAQKMNALLHDLGVQYKQGKTWLLYSKYHDKGYTHSKSFDYEDSNGLPQVRLTTEWTQKGRLFLYDLLKKNGYLPVIEQSDQAS